MRTCAALHHAFMGPRAIGARQSTTPIIIMSVSIMAPPARAGRTNQRDLTTRRIAPEEARSCARQPACVAQGRLEPERPWLSRTLLNATRACSTRGAKHSRRIQGAGDFRLCDLSRNSAVVGQDPIGSGCTPTPGPPSREATAVRPSTATGFQRAQCNSKHSNKKAGTILLRSGFASVLWRPRSRSWRPASAPTRWMWARTSVRTCVGGERAA